MPPRDEPARTSCSTGASAASNGEPASSWRAAKPVAFSTTAGPPVAQPGRDEGGALRLLQAGDIERAHGKAACAQGRREGVDRGHVARQEIGAVEHDDGQSRAGGLRQVVDAAWRDRDRRCRVVRAEAGGMGGQSQRRAHVGGAALGEHARRGGRARRAAWWRGPRGADRGGHRRGAWRAGCRCGRRGRRLPRRRSASIRGRLAGG